MLKHDVHFSVFPAFFRKHYTFGSHVKVFRFEVPVSIPFQELRPLITHFLLACR